MIENNDDLLLQINTLKIKVEFLAEIFMMMSFQEYGLNPPYMAGLSEFIKSALLDHVKLIEKDFKVYEENTERILKGKPIINPTMPEGAINRI